MSAPVPVRRLPAQVDARSPLHSRDRRPACSGAGCPPEDENEEEDA